MITSLENLYNGLITNILPVRMEMKDYVIIYDICVITDLYVFKNQLVDRK
jgi:hypothetical protein